MNKKLGGTQLILDGVKFDYPFMESIASLKEFCDEIVICHVLSDDGTTKAVRAMEDEKTKVIYIEREEWDSMHGWAKLNYFTNKAIAELTSEWHFSQQADEVVLESCYPAIREAIEYGDNEAYLISRINLWSSPFTALNVQGNRNPCSTQIVRLAKSKYMTGGDAESIFAPASTAYLNKIRLYHFGFVRKKEVHCDKIRNMQANIFEVGVDAKLEGMEVFDPTKWFLDSDLEPLKEPLPRIMQKWALERM